MKRSLFYVLLLLLIVTIYSSTGFAIGQNDNQSAEFIRTLNRSASTEVDAAYFNPAGLSFMKRDGLFFNFADQAIFQNRKVTTDAEDVQQYVGNGESMSYESRAYTYFYPVLYLVYKDGPAALYTHLGFIGAGANVSFKDGLPSFDILAINSAKGVLATVNPGSPETLEAYNADISLKAYSVYLGASFGASYAFTDWLSFSGGIRLVYAYRATSLDMKFKTVTGSSGTTVDQLKAQGYFTDVEVDSIADGNCYGIILGFDIRPEEKLNIGTKFEYHSPMELVNREPDTYKAPTNLYYLYKSQFEEGESTKITLPQKLTIGASYFALDDLKVEVSLNLEFNRWTDWGEDEGGDKIATKYNNGYGWGGAVEYCFNSQWLASVGFTRSDPGRTKEVTTETEFDPPRWALGMGGGYRATERIDFTLGFMYVWNEVVNGIYNSDQYKLEITDTYNIALGMTYKII